jgi:cell division protein ZapD
MSNVIPISEKIEQSLASQTTITFEHPLNETIRLCLLLEQLFQQAQADIQLINTTAQANHAMDTLIKIMHVVDRPDLKGKLSKCLSQQAIALSQLENNPNVDQAKLGKLLHEMDQIADQLHAQHNKFGTLLKDNPILKVIAQHASSPGGAAYFNTPLYLLWLQKPHKEKQRTLQTWLATFSLIHRTIEILLRIIRNNQVMQSHEAQKHFFQTNLATSPVTQLIRVQLPIDANVWPEISVGRHRLAIYFKPGDTNGCEIDSALIFGLACCF